MKKVKILRNVERYGEVILTPGEYLVNVKLYQPYGGFNAYSADGLMEGDISTGVVCEFIPSGKVHTLILDYELRILRDA